MILPSELAVRVERQGSDTVIVVCGEIDIATADELASPLRDAVHSVIVDLSGVMFCDSSGLAILARAHDKLEDIGHRLVIVGAQPNVRRVFEITGLTSLLADCEPITEVELEAS